MGLLYGQRALLMQATDPVAFTGLAASTTGFEAPFKRLVRTATIMERVFFGTREQALRVTASVRRKHARVRGETDRDAGPHPAGTSYAADRPDMLLWVLACLADSALVIHRCFVGPLADSDHERYWEDYLLVGELFGLPREHAPADYAGFRAYMRERLASPDLHVTAEAREIGREVAFEVPVPAHRRAALPAINLAVAGTLPRRVRRLYDIPWTPAHDAAFHTLAVASRAARAVVPNGLVRGPSAGDYRAVARVEAARLRRAA